MSNETTNNPISFTEAAVVPGLGDRDRPYHRCAELLLGMEFAGLVAVLFSVVKDRKLILKSFKSYVVKIALEEFGHMVLLALFDCVDDTKMVQKIILSVNNTLKKN